MQDGNKKNWKTKVVSVSLPMELAESLERICYFNFLNKSTLVSVAISEYLENNYDYFPGKKEDGNNG